MREERFPWGLGAIVILVIVGAIGFWLGSSSVAPVIVPVAAPVAPAPAPVIPVYPTYAPQTGGFPLIPFLFGLLFLFVVFKVIRGAAWASHVSSNWRPDGGRGRSWYGPQHNSDEMFQQWHERLHGAPDTRTKSAPANAEARGEGSLKLPPSDPSTGAPA